jgi:hypothetical protein
MGGMDFFRELDANLASTYLLKPGYYWLTTSVGLAAVAVSCWLMFVVHTLLTPLTTTALGTVFGVAIFLLSIPFVIYGAAVCVAGAFGAAMVCLKQFTPSDAVHYALLSRYPKHWLKQ